jgi:multiple sugar transport system permease protein
MAAVVGTSRPRRHTRMRRRETRAAYSFLAPWIIGFCVFTLGPMIASLALSFTDYDGLGKAQAVGLQNYQELLQDPTARMAMGNTFLYALLYVPASTVISIALALLLAQVGRAQAFFRTVFYLPVLTPAVAASALFLLLLNGNNGLVNEVLGWVGISGPNWTTDNNWLRPSIAIVSLWSLGGSVVINLAAIKAVPVDLYEAASLDGAGPFRRFFSVTLPMISAAVFFTVIVHTIGALQMFDQAYTMFFGNAQTSSYANDSALVYLVYLFQQAFEYMHMGYASALAWIIFLVILAITAIQVKVGNRFVYYEGDRDG